MRRLTWILMAGAMALTLAVYLDRAEATPAAGFVGTTLAFGRYGEIDVSNFRAPVRPNEVSGRALPWISHQKTKGLSDLYVQSNVWQPGGTTGWHTHPGHSLITVTAGTLTAYDAECIPREYTVGQGLVDEGGDHVHLIRNEGAVEARTITVQLIPAGATRRVDVDAPDNCPVV